MYSFVQRVLEEQEIPSMKAEELMVLIPKETKPSSIRNFRPISLRNVVIKLITKTIVKRLRGVWGEIIASTQASFVLG